MNVDLIYIVGGLSITLFQHFKNFQKALWSKVQDTLNLHKVFMNISLDFFLMLLSCVSIIENSEQVNYKSACTFQDTFTYYHISLKMLTYFLNLGMISDADYVHENKLMFKYLTAQDF